MKESTLDAIGTACIMTVFSVGVWAVTKYGCQEQHKADQQTIADLRERIRVDEIMNEVEVRTNHIYGNVWITNLVDPEVFEIDGNPPPTFIRMESVIRQVPTHYFFTFTCTNCYKNSSLPIPYATVRAIPANSVCGGCGLTNSFNPF